METVPRIFIASSSEGLSASNAVEAVLTTLSAGTLMINHWKNEFDLSKLYMESLEDQVNECDFGIFVLTADDLLHTRSTELMAPRDNVIFELGLFMGGIGRNRCFVFVESSSLHTDIKVPSDLLGLETARFIKPADGNWADVLEKPCTRILQQVKSAGSLYRLPADTPVFIRFRERLLGYWWERIDNAEAGPLSFMHVSACDPYNSLKLEGTSFTAEGEISARWESQLVNIIPGRGEFLYHWSGRKQDEANISFSGFGTMKFDVPAMQKTMITSGHGYFFNINEARVKESLFKTFRLKKIIEEQTLNTMLFGKNAGIKAAVMQVMEEW